MVCAGSVFKSYETNGGLREHSVCYRLPSVFCGDAWSCGEGLVGRKRGSGLVSEGPLSSELRARAEATLSERERGVSRGVPGAMAMGSGMIDLSETRVDPTLPRSESAVWRGVYPGMCVNPETCRGKTSCPRDYSCCE
jgi:hypothetical protein